MAFYGIAEKTIFVKLLIFKEVTRTYCFIFSKQQILFYILKISVLQTYAACRKAF